MSIGSAKPAVPGVARPDPDTGPDLVIWIKIVEVPPAPGGGGQAKRIFFESADVDDPNVRHYGQFKANEPSAAAWVAALFAAFQGGGTITFRTATDDDVMYHFNDGFNPPGSSLNQVFPPPTHRRVTSVT
jgi:hypothetical protein